MQSPSIAPEIGHNNPPATLAERLALDHKSLLDRMEMIAARANGTPKEFATDADVSTATTLVADILELKDKFDEAHKSEKEPFLSGGRAVDTFFGSAATRELSGPRGRLKRMLDAIQTRADAYAKKKADEARRIREAEEARIRDAAAAAAKAAEQAAAAGRTEDAVADLRDVQAAEDQLVDVQSQPIVVAPVVTESGAKAAGKTEWDYEVQDWDLIPLDKLRPYLKREEIEKAMRAYLKHAQATAKLTGVRFFERDVMKFRR